jgi:hypothetical protein
MTVARLEELRKDKNLTKHGTGPIGPYHSKGVKEEEEEEADITVYYLCCVNTVVTKCVCMNLLSYFLRRRFLSKSL